MVMVSISLSVQMQVHTAVSLSGKASVLAAPLSYRFAIPEFYRKAKSSF